jgi:O-antigen ligase
MNTVIHKQRAPDNSEPSDHGSTGILKFLFNLRFSHWMLLIYPVFLFAIQRKHDFEAVYDIDQSAYLQIGFTCIIGIYMIIRIFTNKYILKQFLFSHPLIWLFLYFVLAIFSAIWAEKPSYTLYRSIEALVFLLLIIDALVFLDLNNMLKFQALFGLVLIISWQFSSLLYEFSFESLHNPLISGTVIYLAFLGLLLPGIRWKIIYTIIVLSILLATSSASYLALLVGIGGVIIFSGGGKRFLGLGLIIFTCLLIWTYSFDYIDVLFWGKSESNIMTASGRIPVWQWVYDEYVVLRPYFGYGFGEGEILARLNNLVGLRMQHMHNVVMGALTNLGFVGLTLFLIFLFDNTILMIKEKNFPHRSIFIGGALALTMNALSISSLTSPISFGFIGQAFFIVMIACVLNGMKFKDKEPSHSENIT